MSPLRAVVLLCSLLALSACGSSSQGSQPADTQQTPTAPPIKTIDEPADVLDYATLVQGTNIPRRYLRELIRTYQPAKGAEPRAIARLRLSAGQSPPDARLVAWRNVSDRLCVQTQLTDVSSSPGGPCYAGDPCGKLCLELTDRGDESETLYVLSGIVDSKADALRVTFEDGRVESYALAGPLVPGFPEYRVFMLDLGRELYRRLELRLGDEVLGEETVPPGEITIRRCMENPPPVLPSQDGSRPRAKKCVPRAGPQ